jgi:hypothetical protein
MHAHPGQDSIHLFLFWIIAHLFQHFLHGAPERQFMQLGQITRDGHQAFRKHFKDLFHQCKNTVG